MKIAVTPKGAAKKIVKGKVIAAAKGKLKRELTLLPLFGLIYFTVCGGSFGAEPMVGWSGPGLAMLLFILTPLFFSIPNMLMVREMQSMMPVEGGYYHWLKKAFGPFVGFLGGWMNWVVSWVDVSIYPVLAAYYLGYFIPALRQGTMVGGVFVSSTVLSFLVAVVLIWGVSMLNMRGARLSGLTTNWLGLVMLLPLIAMSVMGLIVWIRNGTTDPMPFLPGGEPVTFDSLMGALSTGIFVAMWNFMGWELPTAAGDEIVNPKKTYPIAMVLVLVAAIATYAIPTITGLYGGAGEGGKYQLWGIEEYASGEGIGVVLDDYGVPPEQVATWRVDTSSSVGWEFPDIAHAVADKFTGQTNGTLARYHGRTRHVRSRIEHDWLIHWQWTGRYAGPVCDGTGWHDAEVPGWCASALWNALGFHPGLCVCIFGLLAVRIRCSGCDRRISQYAGADGGVLCNVEIAFYHATGGTQGSPRRLGWFGAGHAHSRLDYWTGNLQPIYRRRHGIHFMGIDRHGNGGAGLFPDQTLHKTGCARCRSVCSERWRLGETSGFYRC